MIKNIGLNDKKLRVLFSLIIALVAIIIQVWWIFIVSVLLFITAFVGVCPVYLLFRINTNKTTEPQVKMSTPQMNVPLTPVMPAKKSAKKPKKTKKSSKAKKAAA